MNLTAVFLTGLFTGGLSCMAVQGGLLASTLAQRQKEGAEKNILLPTAAFIFAKIIAYTILGFLLGIFGSVIQLSLTARIIMQSAAVIFMIGTALNLLEAHPVFRYFVIKPPKFLFRIIRRESRSGEYFAPLLVGAFTIFVPCGTTQAMMALALASGNPFIAATIMFTFTLGTSPLFFIFGFLATKLSDYLHRIFVKIAAVSILLLAVFNLNSALLLSGSNITLSYIWQDFACTVLSSCENRVLAQAAPVQNEATINFSSTGYSPQSLTVKSGAHVKLNLVNANAGGCIQAFTIPKLGIDKIVRTGTTQSVEFQAPDDPQDLNFMCGMGMYRGIIRVI